MGEWRDRLEGLGGGGGGIGFNNRWDNQFQLKVGKSAAM